MAGRVPVAREQEALSLDAITSAALDVIRRVGVGGLTIRVLADELGVSVAAAYRHVPSKGALLEIVLDSVLAQVPIPVVGAGDPFAQIAAVTRVSFTLVLDHPGLDALVVRAGHHTPHARKLHDAVIALLIEAGFDRETALHVEEARLRMWLGSVALETARAQTLRRGRPSRKDVAAHRERFQRELDFAIMVMDTAMRQLSARRGSAC